MSTTLPIHEADLVSSVDSLRQRVQLLRRRVQQLVEICASGDENTVTDEDLADVSAQVDDARQLIDALEEFVDTELPGRKTVLAERRESSQVGLLNRDKESAFGMPRLPIDTVDASTTSHHQRRRNG